MVVTLANPGLGLEENQQIEKLAAWCEWRYTVALRNLRPHR